MRSAPVTVPGRTLAMEPGRTPGSQSLEIRLIDTAAHPATVPTLSRYLKVPR